MYRHDYDREYIPSIPIIEVEIGTTHNAFSIALQALVDSGADATVIPIQALQQIGARAVGKKWLRSATGERHQVHLYQVYLRFGEFGQYLTVVGDRFGGEATVGRDLLNRFIVTLNGIDSVTEISD